MASATVPVRYIQTALVGRIEWPWTVAAGQHWQRRVWRECRAWGLPWCQNGGSDWFPRMLEAECRVLIRRELMCPALAVIGSSRGNFVVMNCSRSFVLAVSDSYFSAFGWPYRLVGG